MKWPTNKEQHAYMKMRQEQNKPLAKTNPNEEWMRQRLKATDYTWKRQAQWGYRIFDFWNAWLGIAVEVDGHTHDPVYDAVRDEFNYKKSGIIVLRVRNRNEADAVKVIDFIKNNKQTWNDRRIELGLKTIRFRNQISSAPNSPA